MKILTREEIDAHRHYTLMGGVKGAAAGLLISAAMFRFLPHRYPKFNPKAMTWSVKTALFITPPTLLASIVAEESSNSFDKKMYGDSSSSDILAEHNRWKNLPMSEKLVEGLSNNKYKIIVGAWAASLYGSWKLVDRDLYMTKAQKAVQARMYAQGITVILLLASIGLSMYEEKLHPDQKKEARDRRWQAALEHAEKEEEMAATAGYRSNEDRVKAKIFKYD
ncbi:Rcf2 [Kluyveromyces lactis]|uniref:KLLA0F06006p n=1 Tax=Kluyveromyces lactis (strain ATCC 8585 / CBS 2359 / DSM 70799 / NBRC 1267 / NRRL Y-1140 / WM37) TaxID=284590 RepID=Q6CL37_KLULA|nr:uncharacterized protein KLLA0_F06006g [Kluyveromyces lactis]QEU59052.1 Rcf2 [Kluyveromyces lactis]CAG98060.1 KLLA0F06006p [Kluyveromyces lactis]|eukprot:XP_455352.1 uncharacterized protein KLLA0_F06006g [Kluyveromyces lactis]